MIVNQSFTSDVVKLGISLDVVPISFYLRFVFLAEGDRDAMIKARIRYDMNLMQNADIFCYISYDSLFSCDNFNVHAQSFLIGRKFDLEEEV